MLSSGVLAGHLITARKNRTHWLPAWLVSWAITLFSLSTPSFATAGDASVPIQSTKQATDKSVLILSGVQFGLPTSDLVVSGAVTTLQAKGISANRIHVEFLDLVRMGEHGPRAELAAFLKNKLTTADIGLVVVTNPAALNFLAEQGRVLLPRGTPVLTALVQDPASAWADALPPTLNVVARPDIAGTLRYGLMLFPQVRRVVTIGSVGDVRTPINPIAAQALERQVREGQLAVEDTAELSHKQMLARVANLPADSMVLLGSYFRDGAGRNYVPVEVATEVAQRANRPVLAIYDTHVRKGLTGGAVLMTPLIGQRIGEMAADLLTGVESINAGVTESALAAQPLFDWSQLVRWGANPDVLPPDTVYLNRPRSLWSEYREAVIVASVAISLLGVLVLVLSIEVRRRRQVELELVQQQRVLEKKVQERTAELTEATRKAETANGAKSQFLANMSHEIRTPLNAIIGLTQLLQKKPLEPDAQRKLSLVQTSGRHLLQVINDVLDFSKIEAGKLEIMQEPITIPTIAANVVSMLSDAAAAKNIALRSEIADVPLVLRGDGLRLTQALLNLASNALKFTATGSVTIGLSQVQETATQVELRFEVRDTGIGC